MPRHARSTHMPWFSDDIKKTKSNFEKLISRNVGHWAGRALALQNWYAIFSLSVTVFLRILENRFGDIVSIYAWGFNQPLPLDQIFRRLKSQRFVAATLVYNSVHCIIYYVIRTRQTGINVNEDGCMTASALMRIPVKNTIRDYQMVPNGKNHLTYWTLFQLVPKRFHLKCVQLVTNR